MDATTMALALALGNLALCVPLFFFTAGAPGSPALSLWSVARQVQAIAWLLLYFGALGKVPGSLALPGGSLLLFAGIAIEAGAQWEAAGSERWRPILVPLLCVAAVLFLLAWLVDETLLGAVVYSLILGLFYLAQAAALAHSWRAASILQRFLALAIALLALALAARGVLLMPLPEGRGWLSFALLRQISLASLYVLSLLSAFGSLLLARERLQQELARMQVIDPLTDVANRRGFLNALAPWMALARRPGHATALVLLDLDNFKRVNDSYGHPAGDVVLRQLAEVCRRQLRDSDQLGRLTGVEFAILLPRTGLEEAALVAERVRAALESTAVKTGRALVKLTASFGVTTIRADDSTVTLFQRADQALQAAKQAGRNRVELAPAATVPE
ncbi:GGDEF domain-containing protein [Massilia horti]|uniref:diguanylate cyclase n=2 Tax=Massilia horti TaxID=2562153 RepID=A0A4Y9T843_9BURK|nr:GGDEF domain-containing protein [Massilia horti]